MIELITTSNNPGVHALPLFYADAVKVNGNWVNMSDVENPKVREARKALLLAVLPMDIRW